VAVEEGEGEEKTYFGYVCFGHTPMTRQTYDLYWIVVDPGHRGKGIGQELLRALTATLAHNGCRILRVETSSSVMYRSAKGFYKRAGFVEGGAHPELLQRPRRPDHLLQVGGSSGSRLTSAPIRGQMCRFDPLVFPLYRLLEFLSGLTCTSTRSVALCVRPSDTRRTKMYFPVFVAEKHGVAVSALCSVTRGPWS
jgi:hypothetical protein